MATPWRWPKGSPVLLSLVRRIKPLVTSSGEWLSNDFEIIMNAAWDTYNNWGLRAAFNPPETYTPVPWHFARLAAMMIRWRVEPIAAESLHFFSQTAINIVAAFWGRGGKAELAIAQTASAIR